MRLLTFTRDELRPPRLGALLGEQVLDLAAAAAAVRRDDASLRDMQSWLDSGAEGREAAADLLERCGSDPPPDVLHSWDDVRLLAPLPRPRSLRDCLSFERHWIQCAQTVASWKLPPLAWLDRALFKATGRSLLGPPRIWRQRPIYYKGNPATVVGPEAEVRWPASTERLDFELEIAVYIGRPGRDIAVERSLEHVAGYSLFNDFSARDVQFQEMRGRLGPAKSKDFDTGNVLGPWLVTPDEVEPEKIAAEVRVNGEVWAATSSESLQHSVAETVAFLSRDETLHAGDVIGLGTLPHGCGLELNRWIARGDTVEFHSDVLGTLRNRVV